MLRSEIGLRVRTIFTGAEKKVSLHSNMRERHAIHVVLRDGFGRYLAGERNGWSFTDDFTQARVFDFIRDRIAEQVESLRREHGLELSILAVDPLERYEICDGCGSRSMPYSTFFDGNKFLCPTCNAARGHAVEGEESLKG